MYFRCGSANNWWLRSANSGTNFVNVNNNGNGNNNNATNANGVVFGFYSVRQSNQKGEISIDRIEGEYNRRFIVNISRDEPGRTLLAW